jgi:YVTN family beta-propeller protein
LLSFIVIANQITNSAAQFFSLGDEKGMKVGSKPIGLALNSDMSKLYVAYEFSNRISVIDLETGVQIKTIPVERFPHLIASDPEINRIYVTNGGSNSVSVIDGDTDTLMDPIQLPGKTVAISVDPVSHRAFVVNGLDEYNVSAIDINTNSITGRNVTLGFSEGRVAFIPYSDVVFATIPEENSILGINGSTNLILFNLTMDTSPYDLAFNPMNNLMYIVDESPSMTVINGTTNEIIATNISLHEAPSNIAVNPFLGIVYLANSDSNTIVPFSFFNGTTFGFGAPIKVGQNPSGMAIDMIRNRLYVANSDSNTISIIDGTNLNILVGVNITQILMTPVMFTVILIMVFVPTQNTIGPRFPKITLYSRLEQ